MGTGATLGFSLPLHIKHRPRRAFLRGRPPHSPPGPRLPSAAPTSTNRSHRDARCQRRLLPPPPPKKKHYPVGSPTQAFTGGWHQPSPLLGPEYGTSPTVTAAGGVEIPPHTHTGWRSTCPKRCSAPTGGTTRGNSRPSPRPRVSAARWGESQSSPGTAGS